jgi:hypothetical protein
MTTETPVTPVPTSTPEAASGSSPEVVTPNVEVVTPAPTAETPAEGSTSETPEGSAPNSPARPRAQERIEELVVERNAAKEYADYWREQAMKLMQNGSPAAPAPTAQAAPVEEKRPTMAEHGYDAEKFADAMSAWTDKQIEKRVASAVDSTLSKREDQKSFESAQASFATRTEAFKAAAPDFDIVMANPKLPQLAPGSARFIIASDVGPQVVYHLAKNPDKLARMARQSPEQQAFALGRLEQELRGGPAAPAAAAPKPAPKPAATQSQAPAPPTPVPAGSAPVTAMDANSVEEFMTRRRTEMRKRVGGRLPSTRDA